MALASPGPAGVLDVAVAVDVAVAGASPHLLRFRLSFASDITELTSLQTMHTGTELDADHMNTPFIGSRFCWFVDVLLFGCCCRSVVSSTLSLSPSSFPEFQIFEGIFLVTHKLKNACFMFHTLYLNGQNKRKKGSVITHPQHSTFDIIRQQQQTIIKRKESFSKNKLEP